MDYGGLICAPYIFIYHLFFEPIMSSNMQSIGAPKRIVSLYEKKHHVTVLRPNIDLSAGHVRFPLYSINIRPVSVTSLNGARPLNSNGAPQKLDVQKKLYAADCKKMSYFSNSTSFETTVRP